MGIEILEQVGTHPAKNDQFSGRINEQLFKGGIPLKIPIQFINRRLGVGSQIGGERSGSEHLPGYPHRNSGPGCAGRGDPS